MKRRSPLNKTLAVYGSLRRGGHANGLLRGSRWLGADKINGLLYLLGSFPGVKLAGHDGAKVVVDLYEVPDEIWPDLNRYEGHYPDDPSQSLYDLKKVVTLEGNMEVLVYEYMHCPPNRSLIPTGDWFDVA